MSDVHVLIVDDEEALVRSLSYALREEGLRISTAGSGEAALQHALDDIDIVLLDLGLPGIDGMATLDGLRLRCPLLMRAIPFAREGRQP